MNRDLCRSSFLHTCSGSASPLWPPSPPGGDFGFPLTNYWLKLSHAFAFKTIKMRRFISRNPYTGKVLREFEFISDTELDKKIEKGSEAVKLMSGVSQTEKARQCEALANVMEKGINNYAEIITSEVGKPIVHSRMEITRAINHCRYYAKHMGEYLNPTLLKTEAKKKTLIKYEPLGVIFYILPFNFPFWLSFKGALGTLLLGNAVLMQPACSTPLVGEAVEQIFEKAGLDCGQYQVVNSSHAQLDRILSNPLVGGVGFTGSTIAGGNIAAVAGKHLKKSVMELGGNDPFIVLEDADLEQAAKDAVRGRCANAGQVCFSPKRYVLVGRTYEAFRTKLIENLKKVVVGDPMDEKTTMGPLARKDLNDILNHQIRDMPRSWKIFWQSEVKHPFFPITVIEGDYKHPYDVEMFGPVFQLFHVSGPENLGS